MNTTPAKTTTPDETAAAQDAAAKDTETKDAPGTSSAPDDSATAPDDLSTQPEGDAADDDGIADEDLEPDPFETARHGVGAGAAAVVSAALGVVALTGAWSGRVAAERETLIGQIKTSGGGSAAQQISEIYGDAWHTTALVNGVFAVLALLVGIVVLVRPAFGAPADRPQPAWVRAVALAGVALGILGVLISAGMYFDLFASLPRAGTPAGG
ncbi:hypothetical protein JHN61_01700 [Streptomyces sp. MBT67]|uniref:hypothetical protein n=1 Tax=unclassified Streptomyces TaxID=2593676 RepID=UPI00190B3466|nr:MULTISPECIES: hypothetical protein [unclassified Streptomyces]MBK3528552.1 hypothetical protein [Streptomyces sp. MBT72]MBK3534943.1 hypothetical protein [Streptomyces sp. MBT67]MBK3550677.1 hypothetical protein [Streptomyces sp. MBT61]MBK6028669.1 hypothetical protein [Streptomyces sp. MBT59]